MGSLLSPTTELFYSFVNLEDTPVPRDVPEDDVFARAFKQATIAQPVFRRADQNPFAELDSPEQSPQDLVFDDFLENDLEDGDTSPSSNGSSSTKPSFNTPNITTSSNYPPVGNSDLLDARSLATSQLQFPIPNINTNSLQAPQTYEPTTTDGAPFLANNLPVFPKQPRRRNTKRKLRTAEEEASRRAAFLERNRMAAQKCRSRKKRQTNTLEDDLALQEEINARLKEEVSDLLAELKSLKEVYLQCEQECKHAKVKESVGEDPGKRAEEETVGMKDGERGVEMRVDEEEAEEHTLEVAESPEAKEETVEAMDTS